MLKANETLDVDSHQLYPLGQLLSKTKTIHAISVSLPTWSDNVGYEEGDRRVIDILDKAGGYPRFVFHPLVVQLCARLRACLADKGLITPNAHVMVFPSAQAAEACLMFVRSRGTSDDSSHVGKLVDVQEVTQSPFPLVGVVYGNEWAKVFKEFWQHTGLGLSSRQAEWVLSLWNDPSVAGTWAELQTKGHEAKLHIKSRIARLLSPPPLSDAPQQLVSSNDVYLFPCGMAAIYFAQRIILNCFPGRKSVQFGFPYIDTLKMQEKFGPGCLFYGLGSSEELDELECKLGAGEKVSAVFAEFPSNPLLKSIDLQRLSRLAQTFNFAVIIDDTIGNFANVSLLKYADVIVSSLTKVFNGMGDLMAGSAVISPLSPHYVDFSKEMRHIYEDTLFEKDAIRLDDNSMEFESRVRKMNTNAEQLCDYLLQHPRVKTIFYPKYTDNEKYLACATTPQSPGYGSLFSLILSNGKQARKFYDSLKTAKGPSLGTEFTLVCPYTVLAHYWELDWAAQYGVPSHLIRVSVGVEDILHLKHVFKDALDQCLPEDD